MLTRAGVTTDSAAASSNARLRPEYLRLLDAGTI